MTDMKNLPDSSSYEKNREVFHKNETLLNDITTLGRSTFSSTDPEGLHTHIHTESFEICFVEQGRVTWWVDNPENTYTIEGNSIFVTKPNQLHGGSNGAMHPCELYWICIRVRPSNDSVGLPQALSKHFYDTFNSLDYPAFPGADRIQRLFERLLHEHRKPTWASDIAVQAALQLLLIEVIANYQRYADQMSSAEGQSQDIAAAVDWMNQNIEKSFTMEEVASKVNMSVSTFYSKFVEAKGMTPADYRMRKRIDEAKELLEDESLTITRIAHNLGFSSSQYFSTVFKKYCGVSPTEHRETRQSQQPIDDIIIYS